MFLVSILFLTVSACIVGITVVTALRQSTGQALVQLAETTSGTIDETIYARYRDMKIISTLPFVRDENTDAATLQAVLDETKSTYELYSWIGIATNNGIVKVSKLVLFTVHSIRMLSAHNRLKASTDGVLMTKNVSLRPWFQACANATASTPPFVGDPHEALLLATALNLNEPLRLLDVAVPLFAMNGAQIGVIGAHINASLIELVEAGVMGNLKSKAHVDLVILSEEIVIHAPDGSNETTINS